MLPSQIFGIDISEHRSNLYQPQFDRFHNGGVRFCFTRATRGPDYQDPTLSRYLRVSEQYGWVTGAYHFYEANRDPLAQLSNYQAALFDSRPDAHILDIEVPSVCYWEVAVWVAKFRSLYPSRKLGLYTRDSYLDARSDWVDVLKLFDYYWSATWTGSRVLANMEADGSTIPKEGIEQYGTMKYMWEGRWVGVDGNVYAGTQAELLRLVR